ncbi:hypothetical protein [Oenococcus oeni]|uniref:hypothetical protein n=1 Tax=Oenococcus oeni TaxID=1247 RepID=UPI00050F874C|nr:hypothetical protein [Oenococcus oeni]KGH56700.1 hypothetical protein X463_01610 [Oenococcus oeni S22]KGH99990.1 hypothetical protein X293_09595 [Oenococcus oeni IOEB_C52]KGI04381.1 hypothetical protein X298_00060 [Oenococcus oeni IOEB_L65_2]KGI05277.1 hypothetical protein X297_07090 [Oenococcus oeni IOEB_L40_4]KMQ38894.1 hypothetical protein AAX20_01610 [Oenococcus oeni]
MENESRFFPITFRRKDIPKLFSFNVRFFDKLVNQGKLHPIVFGSLKLYKTSDMLELLERKQIK